MARRYLFNQALCTSYDDGAAPCYDVVIVGGGMAGLYTALSLEKRFSVAVIVKGNLECGSSWLAQGGICCVSSPDDTFESHIADTLEAGAGHCCREAVEVLVREAPENIRRVAEYGAVFDRNADGSLHITREGGHHHNRILHCGGDATGREITSALGKACLARENIHIFFDHNLVDILTSEDGAQGVVVNDGTCDRLIKSGNIVIATGGAGQLYRYSTTPEGNTGEGIAACMRAGCRVSDMEFVQFHPTAFAIHGDGERVFLISEAVRGEGAVLRNRYGERFMDAPYQHPLRELAPRDVVTRAILSELEKNGGSCVYLDASSMSEAFFEKRFPTITEKCRENGIFPPRDMIPVHPTQHYLMGGVVTDLDAKTAVPGIYVCGEAACTGVHGANRLASNSTLECLVFGYRAALAIGRNARPVPKKLHLPAAEPYAPCPTDAEMAGDMAKIKALMTEKVGAERRMAELAEAREELLTLRVKYEACNFTGETGYALFSAVETALVIVESALARKESLGSHTVIG